MNTISFSIIIPVYNEATAIAVVIDELQKYLQIHAGECEIIVIDDASADGTGKIIDSIKGIVAIHHRTNRGYGASIKDGIQRSKYDWVLFYDGDGQFPAAEVAKLLPQVGEYDMVVGARNSSSVPLMRRPGKWLLLALANMLTKKEKIPDLNSGLRIVKKEYIKKFWTLLPDAFSITTTLTLLFQQSHLHIKFVPVILRTRAGGKSTVKARQGAHMFLHILRAIILFAPLRVFLPAAFGLFAVALGSLAYDLWHVNINDTTVLLFVSALIVFFFGLVADQISNLRQELQIHE